MSDFEVRGTAEQQAAFFAAMAKAQSEFRAVNKTRTVNVRSEKGSYSFEYAPLDEVFDATMPALNANGFAVFQPLSTSDSVVILRLLITHASGAAVECASSLTRQGKMQEMGSQITYMRRYMYQSFVGVVAEEDDDGNAGDGNQREVARRAPQTRQTPPERKTAPIPDYRTKVDSAPPSQAQQAATPVPPKVAVSAPAGPSPAVGAAVPQNASDKTATSPPASAASEPAPDVAKSGTSPGPIAQAVAEHVATQPVPMTEATGKAIRMALKAAGYNASTQEQAKAKVRSIVDKPSEGMTEAEGQHILEVLASERASA